MMEALRLLCTLLLFERGRGVQDPAMTAVTFLGPSSQTCLDSQITSSLLPFLPLIKATPNNNEIKADNEFGWICQKAKGSTNTETQYITLYDFTNNLPVYSAYRTTPWTYDQQGNQWKTTQFTRKIFDNLKEAMLTVGKWGIRISNYESYTGSGLDRGHLFAAQYATTEDQNKATYRITNTVPQDHDFNSNQWKSAETYMKDVSFKECQTKNGVPHVFTGAVTGFQERKFEITKPNEPNVFEMSIPTHLWTTMICVKPNPNTIVMHSSFIGSNYQKGTIVFYQNFDHFRSDLTEMYKSPNKLFSTQPYHGVLPDNLYDNMPNSDYIFRVDMNMNWGSQIVAKERASCLFETFSYFMRLSGYSVDTVKFSMEALTDLPRRNKRETQTDPEVDEKVSFLMLMINDTHPTMDLELSSIKLTELDNHTNKTVDEHTVDLKKKEYTEQKPGGTEVKVTSREANGDENAVKKVPSASHVINIVLTPRN